MIIKDLQKVYCAPAAKVVEIGIVNVLCGSLDGVSSTSTEQLDEVDGTNIW